MVVADDDVREWGKQDWAAKSADYAAQGYVPISMKDDFSVIYADGVEKAPAQYVPEELPAQEETEEALDDAA